MNGASPQIRLHRTGAPARAYAIVCALGLAALLLLLAPAARADVGSTIIERCTRGESVSGFTQADYRKALAELPTEVEEYSDCSNVIRRAQLAAAGGGGSGTPAAVRTSATPLTPTEQRGIRAIGHTATAPLLVGNQLIHPGVVHADISSAFSTLPNALIGTLAVLAAGALALAARAIRNRVTKRAGN
jgi:hypothetical protein